MHRRGPVIADIRWRALYADALFQAMEPRMPTELTSREVCQRLRDAALGVCTLRVTSARADRVSVEIEGWRLQLDFDGQRLHHCADCFCPDGRQWTLDTRQRFGTDPVSLLSTWELAQIEGLLRQRE